MSVESLLIQVLLFAGVAVAVLSCLGALVVDDFYTRLHFITPVTSLAAPLIGLSLAIDNGLGLTTAMIVFIVFLLGITGPQLEAVTGRAAAQREGIIPKESPE